MGFSDSYRLFLGWLRRERARHLAGLALYGLVRFLAAAGLGWLAAITLGLSPLPAAPLLVAALAFTAAALLFYLALPLLRAPGLRGFAHLVDRAFPDLKDRTISALELGGQLERDTRPRAAAAAGASAGPAGAAAGAGLPGAPSAPSALRYEPAFVAALVDDARTRTAALDVRPALAPRGLGRWAGTLAGVVALSAALLALSPNQFGAAARRLLHPRQGRPPFGLRVSPGDQIVHPGEDVTITAQVRGAGSAPQLVLRGDYEAWRQAPLEARPAAAGDSGWARFAATLTAVQRNMSYRVEVDGHRSRVFTLKLQEPLAVLGFRKHLEFPAYSGLPSQDLNSATGELDGLKGTRATLVLETSGEVATALLLRGAARVPLERLDGHHFRARIALLEPGDYRVRLEDPAGASVEAGPFAINVVPDEFPRVTLEEPRESGFFGPQLHLPIAAHAADDYGLSRAELVVEGQEGQRQRVPLRLAAGAREADLLADWDASPLNLGPGEGVTLWVEVADNDDVSGPKVARSETRAFRVPTVAEMFKQAEEENSEHLEDLSDLSKQQQDLKTKLDEATRALKQADGMSWEKRQELEAAAARQRELLDKIAQASEQVQQSLDKMQEQNLAREEVARKMEELRQLMRQLDSPEMRKMLERLQEAIKKASPEDVQRALENMKLTQQDLLAALERTIQALKQLQKVEKLNAAAKLAEDLARKQKELADQVDKVDQRAKDQANQNREAQQQTAQDLKDLATRQSELHRQAEQLAKSLEELKKELAEQSRPAAAKIDSAQQEMQQNAEPQMEQSQQNLDQSSQSPPNQGSQSRSNARRRSREAHQSMARAANQLHGAQQQMEQDTNEELAQRVRQAAHDLVGISGRQEEVTAGPEVPGELARQQQSLVDGTAQVADQLHRAQEQFGPLPPAIGQGLGEALSDMNRSRDLFEHGNTFQGRTLGHDAVSTVNRTVLIMLESAKSMCSGGKSGGQPKPGTQQQMAGLSQQQQEVNRGTEQLLKRSQMGRPKPSSDGRPGESAEEMAARLAAEQEAVRRGMEDLMRQEMQQRKLLGDLSDVSDKMKRISDDLANNRADEQTVDMEKKILSRMLDAQRSINRRDRDPQRWSRPGEDVARPSPGALPQALLQKPQRGGLDLLRDRKDPVPRAFLPAVEQYFRNLPTPR